MRCTAAVANVTARLCSHRNTAAAVEFLLTLEMLDCTATVGNVTEV